MTISTYAVKTAAKIHYIVATSARQARIVFTRGNPEVVISVKVCRD